MDSILVCLLLYFIARFHLSFSAPSVVKALESVPDLEKSMYLTIDGYPCVRLLNLSGVIGCSNPGRDKVVAPIVRLKNFDQLLQSSAVLVSTDEFESILLRVSNNKTFAKNVAGVLVESGKQAQKKLEGNFITGTGDIHGSSPDKKFPEAEFAPYQSNNFQWNPTGSGIMWNKYDIPVFLLSDSGMSTLKEVLFNYEEIKASYAKDVAEFNLVMQTTKSGTHDSESCLKEETCLPLGGYSVWSALPPINISSARESKPIILTVASMDSASFFRDKSLGAESHISGLISLLAVVDALSHVDGLNGLSKQLVFMVFTGETWGYLGSRRFLLELDQHSDSVTGLNSSSIELVFEIGSVGKSFNQGVKTFYAHTTEVSSSTNDVLNVLHHAQNSLKSEIIKVSKANASNPGIPPSSMMAFLRKNPRTSGIVIEDFDSVFINKFYHSHLDDLSNINSSAIIAAASLVARSLYILASDKNLTDSDLASININSTLVEELIGCLLSCEPGLSCGLVKRYISPSNTCPSHYVGVVLGEPSSRPYSGYVGDVPRFIWNFLAEKTSIQPKGVHSTCAQNCNHTGELCIRLEADGKGVCVISTTRYVPAYSTRLKYESETWKVLPTNSSDPLETADPVWTESNWNVIQLRVYKAQSAAYDRIVLLSGIAVTILAYFFIVLARAFITKSLKRE